MCPQPLPQSNTFWPGWKFSRMPTVTATHFNAAAVLDPHMPRVELQAKGSSPKRSEYFAVSRKE
eukprot:CAMPEP_0204370514 /NCGR_PEP_ID=MMETSP0469-20131031/45791_1 /ASSEMBLY_ACC=CAM_ASM_000384 /TAXON_ID=2969 /ORGANISM="Oxyrrhis marina" /LENGTH=63 /DNA_ID=CAMNT_0051360445 /DNA_START=34 /DNA_END=222 /DNA_ORIENTATION=+